MGLSTDLYTQYHVQQTADSLRPLHPYGGFRGLPHVCHGHRYSSDSIGPRARTGWLLTRRGVGGDGDLARASVGPQDPHRGSLAWPYVGPDVLQGRECGGRGCPLIMVIIWSPLMPAPAAPPGWTETTMTPAGFRAVAPLMPSADRPLFATLPALISQLDGVRREGEADTVGGRATHAPRLEPATSRRGNPPRAHVFASTWEYELHPATPHFTGPSNQASKTLDVSRPRERGATLRGHVVQAGEGPIIIARRAPQEAIGCH